MDGPKLANPLRNAGIHVELHRDHFKRDEDDVIWIPKVAAQGWIAVTDDKRTRIKDAEILAIVQAGARMLYVKKKEGVSMEEIAANFISSLEQIQRHFERHNPPCAASLSRPSKMEDRIAKKPGNVNARQLRIPEHLEHLVSH